jgi:hypothetical protein
MRDENRSEREEEKSIGKGASSSTCLSPYLSFHPVRVGPALPHARRHGDVLVVVRFWVYEA